MRRLIIQELVDLVKAALVASISSVRSSKTRLTLLKWHVNIRGLGTEPTVLSCREPDRLLVDFRHVMVLLEPRVRIIVASALLLGETYAHIVTLLKLRF